jgi:shikimate kinase
MPSQLIGPAKSIVLIGLMGAGKTCIGRRLARRLQMSFVDADEEIVRAAGAPVAEIFRKYGESAFRESERRVIARLLNASPVVLATGGGAFIDTATRELIKQRGISVWLRADLDLLDKRTRGREGRPLLQTEDPRGTLAALMASRYPIYAQADVVVDSRDEPPEKTTDHVLEAVRAYRSDFAAGAEVGT